MHRKRLEIIFTKKILTVLIYSVIYFITSSFHKYLSFYYHILLSYIMFYYIYITNIILLFMDYEIKNK